MLRSTDVDPEDATKADVVATLKEDGYVEAENEIRFLKPKNL